MKIKLNSKFYLNVRDEVNAELLKYHFLFICSRKAENDLRGCYLFDELNILTYNSRKTRKITHLDALEAERRGQI